MKRTLFICLFSLGFSLDSGAAETENALDHPILGQWQSVNAQGKTQFISIIVNGWGNVKLLPCYRTLDSDYLPSDIVVCSSKPNSGEHLNYNSYKDIYTVSQKALTSFSLQGNTLIESSLFGLSEVAWEKANENFIFMYNSYMAYE